MANAEELGRILDDHFQAQRKAEVFHAAHERRFIYGMIQSPEDVMSDPQFEARGFLVDIKHPATGPVKHPGAPFTMYGTPWEIRKPAPTLGQDNLEVLGGQLGNTNTELSRMRALGVI